MINMVLIGLLGNTNLLFFSKRFLPRAVLKRDGEGKQELVEFKKVYKLEVLLELILEEIPSK